VPATFAATLSVAVDGLAALGVLALSASDAAEVAGVARLAPLLSAASLEMKAIAGQVDPFDLTPTGDIFGPAGEILSVLLPGDQELLKLGNAAPGALKDLYDYFETVFGADSTTPACPNSGK
jgi:hypothetical protein